MGQLAILHPQPLMRSPPTIMNPPSQQTPNFTTTAADGRRPTQPPKGILKKNTNRNTEAVTESKKLVMGQVKILKRGEPFNTVLKDVVNDRNLSSSTDKPTKRDHRKASKAVVIGVLPPKKTTENLIPKLEEASKDDEVLSSTHRLGPDPKTVSKQVVKKKVSDCFAGSAFSDSPPPSSVPLPGFFRKNLDKDKDEDDATTNLRRILGLSLV